MVQLVSRTEEPAKAGTCARDRRALQHLAMNVHVKHSDLPYGAELSRSWQCRANTTLSWAEIIFGTRWCCTIESRYPMSLRTPVICRGALQKTMIDSCPHKHSATTKTVDLLHNASPDVYTHVCVHQHLTRDQNSLVCLHHHSLSYTQLAVYLFIYLMGIYYILDVFYIYLLITDGQNCGEIHLFFGCRNPSEDFIYETELRQMKSQGVLTGGYIAFSRQPGKPKVIHR